MKYFLEQIKHLLTRDRPEHILLDHSLKALSVIPLLSYNSPTLVRKVKYSGRLKSILRLLMYWPIESPDHRKPWYWFCEIVAFLASMGNTFRYLDHLSDEKINKYKYRCYISLGSFHKRHATLEMKWNTSSSSYHIMTCSLVNHEMIWLIFPMTLTAAIG